MVGKQGGETPILIKMGGRRLRLTFKSRALQGQPMGDGDEGDGAAEAPAFFT